MNFCKSNFFKFPLVFAGMAFFFSSCFKNDPPAPASYLNVVHASPKTPALDFSLDQNRQDYNNFIYKTYTGYLNAIPGTRAFKVYKSGEATALVTSNIVLPENQFYTLFIVDTLSKMETVLIRDSTRAVSGDSARVRFANMCPDVPQINFYVQGKPDALATGIAYKNAGEFMSVKAGNDMIFEVRENGQSTALAVSEKKDLLPGGYYTIFSSGFKSQTDDAKINIGAMRY